MSKSATKRSPRPAQTEAPAAKPPPLAEANSPRPHKADLGSKQSRVIAMLQSPAGTTIPAMMKATGWQQHSVRGFLASVVRKRLKLKLGSKKVDGIRVYQIVGIESSKHRRLSASRPERHAARYVLHRWTARHSTSRLRACAISTSGSFEAAGKTYRPHPHLPRHLLFRVLAYRLQADVLGDLDSESQRLLDRSVSPEDAGQRAVDARRTANLRPGTVLAREWNGQMQRVAVFADGFAWNGKTYPSLSKVAFAITGTPLERTKILRAARQAI